MSKLFSIVIPTRNRLETAYYAVRSCLHDPADDYEVIVFDNASDVPVNCETLELDDPRVVIHRSEKTLPMFQSWETAVSHAKGDYVTVIGDDDGLLPGTFDVLRSLIPKYPALPIRWARISYHWPNHPSPAKRDSLKIPLSNSGYVLNAQPVITGVAHSRLPHFALPMLYNSSVPRAVLESITKKCGRLFLSTCPDLSSGFAVAYQAASFLSLECPLSIAGISGKSNGVANASAANMQDKSTRPKVAQEFLDLNRDHGMPFPHPSLPSLTIMPVVAASSFLYVQAKLFPSDRNYHLDEAGVFKACLDDLNARPAGEAKQLLPVLDEHVKTKTSLPWPGQTSPSDHAETVVDPMSKPAPRGFNERERILALDTMRFGVQDVHAASILAENILSYKNRGFRLKIKTPKENVLASGRKFLGDLVRRRKVPAFIDCD